MLKWFKFPNIKGKRVNSTNYCNYIAASLSSLFRYFGPQFISLKIIHSFWLIQFIVLLLNYSFSDKYLYSLINHYIFLLSLTILFQRGVMFGCLVFTLQDRNTSMISTYKNFLKIKTRKNIK
jgi:hypothetical protein